MSIVPDNQSKAVDTQTESVGIADNLGQVIFGGAVTVTSAVVATIVFPVAMHAGSILLSVVAAGTIFFGTAGLTMVGKNLFWMRQKRKANNLKKNSEAIIISTPKSDTLVKEFGKENAPILPVGMFSKD